VGCIQVAFPERILYSGDGNKPEPLTFRYKLCATLVAGKKISLRNTEQALPGYPLKCAIMAYRAELCPDRGSIGTRYCGSLGYAMAFPIRRKMPGPCREQPDSPECPVGSPVRYNGRLCNTGIFERFGNNL